MDVGDVVLIGGAGLVGGFVNSIAGGGSLLLFPALVAGGLGTVAANVTNSVALWPGYLGNVAALRGSSRPSSVMSLAVVSAVGAAAGCALLLLTPSRTFSVAVPFLVLGASALLAFQPRLRALLGADEGDHRVRLYAGTLAGAVYGGYFGGGLGVILMALLGLTLSAPLAEVSVLKGTLQLVVATVSLVVFALFGPVHWMIALVVAPASLVGGVLGGRLATRLSEPVLRAAVVGFGVLAGVWLGIRAFG
ncbi:sulfite exporter TauE/SafE family protein [Streptomyces sp. Qhu-G9]|uniref:sulfite exporter TauE/SafE family protein n=1 Tax=Streptomyces sp. Qhu-G9 TaxID=3452799 RepID=UPI0022AC8549|nr:sulfite exporter TauE/SafE family protein [Streptomyces aurantiacus]WAU81146.1 sulfite exporter TauE/SafE family protein [Streptomyces aurantiacus]